MADQQFFERDAFAHLAAQEEGHFWFEERNRLLEWCLRHFFQDSASFCEVGCGTGFVAKHLEATFPKVDFTAAEFFIEALHFANQRTRRTRLLQADARFLPFREAFDVIGAFDVIEHIEEDELVLRQFHKALKPRGGLILTVPQHMFLWSVTDEVSHHKRRYSRSELRVKVQRAGFRPVFCTSFVTSLLPFMFASRWINGVPSTRDREIGIESRGKKEEELAHRTVAGGAARVQQDGHQNSNREFELNPWLNRAFRFALTLERRLIRAGVSLPIGGSLVMVAEKDPAHDG